MKKGVVIQIYPAGLSNRIKCLVSALYATKAYKRELLLYWPVNDECGASFEAMFENNLHQITKEELLPYSKKPYDYYEHSSSLFTEPKTDVMIIDTSRFMITEDEDSPIRAKFRPSLHHYTVDFEFGRTPVKVKNRMLPLLHTLKPRKKIRDAVRRFCDKHNIKDAVGVHVRRTDFLTLKSKAALVSPNALFVKRMQELVAKDSKTKFFLATDSKEVEKEFKNIFKNRIITNGKTFFDRSKNGTIEGFIDQLTLAKTKMILVSYGSSFNELAWWYGDCKPKVEVIIDKDALHNTKNYDDSLISRMKKIRNNIFFTFFSKKLFYSLMRKFGYNPPYFYHRYDL